VQIQNGNQGQLATLPRVIPEDPVGNVLRKMREFRQGAAVVARKNGTFTVVTADEIAIAISARGGEKVQDVFVGELFANRQSTQHADFGAMTRLIHGLWDSRGGQLDYRIVAIGKNAVTVLASTVEHWQRLRGKGSSLTGKS